MSSHEYRIVNGPSKWDLMVSLFEGNPSHRHMVAFSVDTGERISGLPRNSDQIVTATVPVAITMIAQEDGSGDSWIFRGYLAQGVPVHGHYSTKTRMGRYMHMAC